jgi:hypothetical protein
MLAPVKDCLCNGEEFFFPARKQKQDTVKQFLLSHDPAPTSHPVIHTQESHSVFGDINA